MKDLACISRASSLTRRRCILGLAGMCGLPLLPSSSLAAGPRQDPCESLRDQRISWVVGWSAGGGYDAYSRLVEATLQSILQAEIAIQNVPGASGLIGARRLAAAPPDGRTLGILYGAGLMLAPYTNPGFAPDLLSDFTVLGRIVNQSQLLVVGPQLGVATLEQLIAEGRDRALVFGATGPTTMSVLLQAVFAQMFGIRIELVLGFPGTQQLLPAIARGDLDGTITSEDSARSFEELVPLLRLAPTAEAGALTPGPYAPELFGVEGVVATRPELLLDAEAAAIDADALEALLRIGRLVAAPPGLPGPLADCLREAVMRSLVDEQLRARAARMGRLVSPATAHQVADYLRAAANALPRFGDLLRDVIARANG